MQTTGSKAPVYRIVLHGFGMLPGRPDKQAHYSRLVRTHKTMQAAADDWQKLREQAEKSAALKKILRRQEARYCLELAESADGACLASICSFTVDE